MSRFESYYRSLLIEKVTKQEMDEALRNSNIIVGAEFEVIMRTDLRDMDIYSQWQQAHKEWVQITKAMDKYQKDLWNYEKETETFRSKLRKMEMNAAILEKSKDPKDIAKLKILNIDIDKINKIIEYREEEGHVEDLDTPPTDPDQVEYYSSYIEDFMGYNPEKELEGTLYGKEPEMPVDMSKSVEPTFDNEYIFNYFKGFKDAPFKRYGIGQYGEIKQTVGSDLWAIEPDGSLGTNGVEVKSPPMPLPDFIKVLPKVFNWLNKYTDVTSACGLHIHMSLKGVNDISKVLDPIKIILFTEEGYIYNMFGERVDNQYCASMKDKLKSGSIPSNDLGKAFDIKQAIVMVSSFSHNDAINLQNVHHGHIEYRYMGGSNYSRKLGEVFSAIGHFAHVFSVATDETYKKREYIEKLYRIFNKIELHRKQTKVMWAKQAQVKFFANTSENILPSDIKGIEMYINKLEKEMAPLKSVYKLDNNTLKQLDMNSRYISKLSVEYRYELNFLSLGAKAAIGI